MSIERKLVKGETTTAVREVVNVNECIRYIESCGWELKVRGKGRYQFFNNNPVYPRNLDFTLRELRESYLNGW